MALVHLQALVVDPCVGLNEDCPNGDLHNNIDILPDFAVENWSKFLMLALSLS